MKQHTQTIMADPTRGDGHDANGIPGDCWRTAIACITDADTVEEVPHFVHEYADLNKYGMDWWAATQSYIRALYGDDSYLMWWPSVADVAIPGPMLATGPSPRGGFHHVVILDKEGNLLHDPHPSQAGLTSISAVYQIIHEERA